MKYFIIDVWQYYEYAGFADSILILNIPGC